MTRSLSSGCKRRNINTEALLLLLTIRSEMETVTLPLPLQATEL